MFVSGRIVLCLKNRLPQDRKKCMFRKRQLKTNTTKYWKIYRYGDSLDLLELEVFGVGEVDMEVISEFSLALVDFIEKKEVDEEELERLYHFD